MSAAETNARLRGTVFRAPENHGSPASFNQTTTSALLRRIKVYVLPADHLTVQETVRAFHLLLIVCGTSRTTDRYEWQNYLATLVSACYPVMKADILGDPVYEEVTLSSTNIKDLTDWFTIYTGGTDLSSTQEERDASKTMLADMMPLLELPVGTPTVDINLGDVLDIPSVYGHFSVVLFLAGKTITDKNRVAVTQKRPGAIERKYYNGKQVGSLTGSLALSHEAHTYLHLAFVVLTRVRKAVFTHVANFNNHPDDPPTEVVATTTRLMRFAGMQQAVIVDSFLEGHEEAFSVPFLMPAISAYTASMKDLSSAPVEQRAYYKLIHGDTTRAFNRNEISNLLTVALVHARELNPTLLQYNIPPNYQLVMDKYHQALEALATEEE